MRQATAKILTGRNYRLFFEEATRRNLIDTYKELSELARTHPFDDAAWQLHLRQMLSQGTPDSRMQQWLIGLTKKTADNLGIPAKEYPRIFDQVMQDIESVADTRAQQRQMALMLWCGTATLTIRGSRKSKIGKALEKCLAGAALAVVGLQEGRDYRLNVTADQEVDRETDAEVRTPRGWVRMEIGLIGQGNSEVISDKVGRMHRNGIILLDKLPAKSTAYNTAAINQVKLIQLRNGHPVEEMRQHLQGLNVAVQQQPLTLESVESKVMDLPLCYFQRTPAK